MKAIILAAGEGTRLRPFTLYNPKCMIELEGKSILDRQVEVIQACGIEDITVVKGYRQDQITREDINHMVNLDYSTTNMVMTLWCAKEKMEGDVIVSYGDIVYNEEVLKTLMKSPEDISVIVDSDWYKYWSMRFDDPLKDAEAFKMDADNKIKVIGQKAEKISDVQAGYIGLIKFSGKGTEVFKKSFLNAKKAQEEGKNPWGAPRQFKKAYMTDMLQGLVNEGNDVFGVEINGGWLEIDSNSDYALAKKLFLKGEIKI